MDRIDYLADITVRKGVGFALLAVSTVMLGFSYDMLLCLRTGAALIALTSAVLALKAARAPARKHRSTELWALLRKGEYLPPGYPPANLNEVLRKTYIRYAELCAVAALALCSLALAVRVVRG